MELLQEISIEYGIPLIEDSAEALGSTYKGVRAGKFGVEGYTVSIAQTITTGEGGFLLLDDDALFERAKFYEITDHGYSIFH